MVLQAPLERGGNFDMKSTIYGNALNIAGRLGTKEMVQVLLDRQAKVLVMGVYHGGPVRAD